ncbi:hypothetical protein ACFO5R_20435 [Halosolutus amylolyticus]|uniref:Major facilitator superfamily (MFS) profile domain-containing protein n=1 Tax=Halosolutus amylolyticus TaxID=2932267 RepID=A0ABD5PV78_9EURY|nr:hypothetical protein [Halosolutus amylolyticus]
MDRDGVDEGSPAPTDAGEPPRSLGALGQVGVALAVAAVALTAVGLVAALLGSYVLANVALVLAFGLVSIAIVLGAIFRASVGDLPS